MTKNYPVFRLRKAELLWLASGAAIALVYLFGLDLPLLGPDEPRYAQVAREMFERGDWITPTLGGHTWFEKPALLYWLQMASYNLFGVSEFAARLGSALFGLGTIFALWMLGRFAGANGSESEADLSRTSVDRSFADLLALIASSTLGIIVFSRGASFDIILTFPITSAMVSFFVYDRRSMSGGENTTIPLVLFYVSIGLSLLAKGLIGIVFPVAIVAFYLLLNRRLPKKDLMLSVVWGALITLAVSALWYLPVYLRHGHEFVDEFFIQHHFQRYTSNKYFHPQPFYFFFWVLPLMTIPWLPFFFAAVWDAFRKAFKIGGSGRISPLVAFAFAWLAVPLVFFSFSGSKLPGYILPAIPAAVVLIAEFIFRRITRTPGLYVWVKTATVATLVIVTLSLVFVVPKFAAQDSVKALIQTADARGYSSSMVIGFHAVSHNAEFYAAGRLPRDEDGLQKKLLGPAEVVALLRENQRPILLLVPLEYISQATDGRYFNSEILAENGELAIVAATP